VGRKSAGKGGCATGGKIGRKRGPQEKKKGKRVKGSGGGRDAPFIAIRSAAPPYVHSALGGNPPLQYRKENTGERGREESQEEWARGKLAPLQ